MKKKYIIFDLTTERHYSSYRGDVSWSKNCIDANTFDSKEMAEEEMNDEYSSRFFTDTIIEIKEVYSKE